MPEENQIGDQNEIPQQNNNVIRIITDIKRDIKRDGIISNLIQIIIKSILMLIKIYNKSNI